MERSVHPQLEFDRNVLVPDDKNGALTLGHEGIQASACCRVCGLPSSASRRVVLYNKRCLISPATPHLTFPCHILMVGFVFALVGGNSCCCRTVAWARRPSDTRARGRENLGSRLQQPDRFMLQGLVGL